MRLFFQVLRKRYYFCKKLLIFIVYQNGEDEWPYEKSVPVQRLVQISMVHGPNFIVETILTILQRNLNRPKYFTPLGCSVHGCKTTKMHPGIFHRIESFIPWLCRIKTIVDRGSFDEIGFHLTLKSSPRMLSTGFAGTLTGAFEFKVYRLFSKLMFFRYEAMHFCSKDSLVYTCRSLNPD